MRKIKINKHGEVEIQHFDGGGIVNGGQGITDSSNPLTLSGPGTPTTSNVPAPGIFNNFQAGQASVQAGTNTGQLNTAYGQTQQGIGLQTALANAYAPGATSAVSSQQALLQALQAQSQGQGPNPAQAALNQNTGANIASETAIAAGQRGSSANAGQIERQVAQQGAVTQQNAVGQEATLQAQQQLAAQQELQAQQAQLTGQETSAVTGVNSTAQNEQNILEGANTAYNSAGVSMQNGINAANASTSAANSGMFGQILGGVSAGAAAGLIALAAKGGKIPTKEEMMAAGGVTGAENLPLEAKVFTPNVNAEGQPLNSNPASATAQEAVIPSLATPSSSNNASIAQGVANYMSSSPSNEDLTPDEINSTVGAQDVTSQTAVPAAVAPTVTSEDLAFAKGGSVPEHMRKMISIVHPKLLAKGGKLDANARKHIATKNFAGPDRSYPIQDAAHARNALARGAQHASPEVLAKIKAKVHAKYPNIGKDLKADGGKIPGKPKVDHDSYKNDVVDAKLTPGEVVLPLHVMNSDDPASAAAKFVQAILSKHGKKTGSEQDDFQEALKSAIKSRKK